MLKAGLLIRSGTSYFYPPKTRKKINSPQCNQNVHWATYFTCSNCPAGDLQNLSRSEHVKFNYVESLYSLKISFQMILCLFSLQVDVKSENLRTIWQEVTVRDPKPCKYFSKQYMLNVKMLPLNIQSKWEKEVHTGVVIEDYNWSFIYCIPFSVTKDTKLQDFQYKLIHRIPNYKFLSI